MSQILRNSYRYTKYVQSDAFCLFSNILHPKDCRLNVKDPSFLLDVCSFDEGEILDIQNYWQLLQLPLFHIEFTVEQNKVQLLLERNTSTLHFEQIELELERRRTSKRIFVVLRSLKPNDQSQVECKLALWFRRLYNPILVRSHLFQHLKEGVSCFES